MQNPVLIFAQSGRFLAQIATQAGYSAWVADCFGDQDCLSVAQRWQQVAPFSELTQDRILSTFSKLSQGKDCSLICGSGIEHCYPILDKLPSNIQIIGNTAHTIHLIKTPSLFFALLSQLGLPYPDTQFEPPGNTTNWLVKSASGLGGNHIQYLNRNTSHTANNYYQYRVTGDSGSVLFLANGEHAQFININKQTLAPNKQSPFRLGSVEISWEIAASHQQQLEQAVSKITAATGLLGLNSLDFIISEGDELLLLEVNPRPSASAELANSKTTLFQYHINACQGILPDKTIASATAKTCLYYIYANDDVTIPSGMVWPEECHDLPTAGTIIKQDEPLCTFIIQANNSQQLDQLRQTIELQITKQILDPKEDIYSSSKS